jgi:hypothetical protein
MENGPLTMQELIIPPEVEVKSRNQTISRFLGSMRPGVLFVFIVISNLLIVSLGTFIGYERLLAGHRPPETPIETAVAAVLGLLSFMLAFTFSLTWGRFATRNDMMISHARMIGVCWLRTSLIPQKQKQEVRRLLHDYTNTLMTFQTTNTLEKSLNDIDTIHLLIWDQTASLVHEDIDSELRSLFTASVNDLVSLATERKSRTLFLRIPDAIWNSLLFLAIIGMLALGYQAGIGGLNRLFHLPLLPIAFAIVIVLISELNSPTSRQYFNVTQKPLLDVLRMMDREIR